MIGRDATPGMVRGVSVAFGEGTPGGLGGAWRAGRAGVTIVTETCGPAVRSFAMDVTAFTADSSFAIIDTTEKAVSSFGILILDGIAEKPSRTALSSLTDVGGASNRGEGTVRKVGARMVRAGSDGKTVAGMSSGEVAEMVCGVVEKVGTRVPYDTGSRLSREAAVRSRVAMTGARRWSASSSEGVAEPAEQHGHTTCATEDKRESNQFITMEREVMLGRGRDERMGWGGGWRALRVRGGAHSG